MKPNTTFVLWTPSNAEAGAAADSMGSGAGVLGRREGQRSRSISGEPRGPTHLISKPPRTRAGEAGGGVLSG